MSWSKSRVPSAHIGRRPRAVVVTGGSSRIGRASAMKLARSGFYVFAGVRKEEDAEALEEAALPGRLTPLFIDVTDEHLVAAAATTIEEAVGDEGIAGLVNNGSRSSRARPLPFEPPDPALRYASHYAPVTPRQYPKLYEQEPTSGEGGECERSIA